MRTAYTTIIQICLGLLVYALIYIAPAQANTIQTSTDTVSVTGASFSITGTLKCDIDLDDGVEGEYDCKLTNVELED